MPSTESASHSGASASASPCLDRPLPWSYRSTGAGGGGCSGGPGKSERTDRLPLRRRRSIRAGRTTLSAPQMRADSYSSRLRQSSSRSCGRGGDSSCRSHRHERPRLSMGAQRSALLSVGQCVLWRDLRRRVREGLSLAVWTRLLRREVRPCPEGRRPVSLQGHSSTACFSPCAPPTVRKPRKAPQEKHPRPPPLGCCSLSRLDGVCVRHTPEGESLAAS